MLSIYMLVSTDARTFVKIHLGAPERDAINIENRDALKLN